MDTCCEVVLHCLLKASYNYDFSIGVGFCSLKNTPSSIEFVVMSLSYKSINYVVHIANTDGPKELCKINAVREVAGRHSRKDYQINRKQFLCVLRDHKEVNFCEEEQD
jgi:hypothetical protein